MKNEDLGYDEFFELDRIKQGFTDSDVARVISEHKGLYILKNTYGEFSAKVRGKSIYIARTRYDYPVVGDWVVITILGNKQAVIESILKRKTIISRSVEDRSKINNLKELQIIASNIDVAFIVQSVDRDYSLNRFERYISIAEHGGVIPILILNKIDLIDLDKLSSYVKEIKERFGEIKIITTSATEELGLENIFKYLEKGKTYCFLGSSGVGKSSIIKSLTNNKNIKIADISGHAKRGKHTTTERHMYFINEGVLIDNPGIREVGVVGNIDNVRHFNDLSSIKDKCKFSDCTHTHEPGCIVIKKISEGKINKEKYSNYISMKKEAEYSDMSEYEKRKKDKNFGKLVKSVLKNKNNRIY